MCIFCFVATLGSDWMESRVVNYKNEDNSFNFSNTKHAERYEMKQNHFHSPYEIYYLLSGERYYFIKDRAYYIKKGDIVFINSNELHKAYNAENPSHQRALINFEQSYMNGLGGSAKEIVSFLFHQNAPVISLSLEEQIRVETLFGIVSNEIENKKIGYEISIQAQVIELMVACARFIESHKAPVQVHLSPVREKVFEIVRFINENYAEPLTLPYISAQFYISPYYLSRIFKETTGFTFVEYLNSIRVQQAQKLLRETKLSVMEISEKVGFGSITQFGRKFKDITKISPLNYRKTQ
jgi:AraC-like DNA-binding protein/quercetin dioxygenase-like cupin family protein